MDVYKYTRLGKLSGTDLDKYLKTYDINDVNSSGWTLLATAAKAGLVKIVELLLGSKADANTKNTDGYAPIHLAANAKKERAQTTKNVTVILIAITQARDPEVIKVLRKAGVDLNATTKDGETAKDLAESSNLPALSRLRAITWVVNVAVSILSYVNQNIVIRGITRLFGLFRRTPKTLAKPSAPAIHNSITKEEFAKDVAQCVKNTGLEKFFAPDNPFLQQVAEKVSKLRDDPNNLLNKPDQIRDLTRLALYQAALCRGMYYRYYWVEGNDGRINAQRELVERTMSIATRLVPDDKVVHLRFINRSGDGLTDLQAEDIRSKLNFVPSGGTEIGTSLKEKALKPFIYDVLRSGLNLERPYLILTITDGCPTTEKEDTFETAITECNRKLVAKKYRPQAVMGADAFLRSLIDNKPALKQVLEVTAGILSIRIVSSNAIANLESEKLDAE
ncbi:ankyrin repeat protein [Aspergillus alliaceus]|uniref:ankyrin repeat protein n=1 Tax=Petromyces alliaceus TaxID=209559 RepID=UPI0012A47176|nr:uncharacterized protein BDW43DRAFT_322060 [Aspergillus alliaceus]KAB8229719.1 hypothetical protein BDW43DRAFT_322060 [Aspergillus alliaceus]